MVATDRQVHQLRAAGIFAVKDWAMVGTPPDQVLSPEQREADERLLKRIAPEGGLPPDVRLEMRISALAFAR